MIAFWVLLAVAAVSLCFKKTHAALLIAAVLAFFVGVHVGTVAGTGHTIDTFITSIPRGLGG